MDKTQIQCDECCLLRKRSAPGPETDYQAARKQVGQPDNVSFESFIAKLKVNEGKLKALHQCKTVRFRVVTADGKVSLKSIPIK